MNARQRLTIGGVVCSALLIAFGSGAVFGERSIDESLERERSPRDEAKSFTVKRQAIEACESDGGTVAMGFDFDVVCIPEQCRATSTPIPTEPITDDSE